MSIVTANPPLDSVNGAYLTNGTIICGTTGLGLSSPPALYTFDPKTNISKPLLNNYRGLRFSTPNDLIVDQRGNILFTDAPFGHVCCFIILLMSATILSHIHRKYPMESGHLILVKEF